MTVATRAPGFSLNEILYLDGRSHPTDIVLLGGPTLNASAGWSNDHQQLISTYQIKTKPGKDGELTIKRYLINGMKSEGVLFHSKAKRTTRRDFRPTNLEQASVALHGVR